MAARGVRLKGDDLSPPVAIRAQIGPATEFHEMHEYLFQIRLHRMQLRKSHILDLLGDMSPVDIVHPFAARDPAQPFGLLFRPGEDILFVESVRHNATIGRVAPEFQR